MLKGIAAAHNKTVGQVILRWNVQRGVTVIPKSTHKERIEENFNIWDFVLTDEEMERIAAVNKHVPFYQVTPESLQRLATTKCNFEEE